MSVFVLDRSGSPLMPCSEKRARLLLARGRTRVHRLIPFATGRVAVRAGGSFNIQAGNAVVQGIGHKHCRLIQRADGYGYARLATVGKNEKRLPDFLPILASRSRGDVALQRCA